MAKVIIEPGGSYTTAEVCAWLGCERHRLAQAMRAGQVRPLPKLGKGNRFLGQDLLNLRSGQVHRPRLVTGGHHR